MKITVNAAGKGHVQLTLGLIEAGALLAAAAHFWGRAESDTGRSEAQRLIAGNHKQGALDAFAALQPLRKNKGGRPPKSAAGLVAILIVGAAALFAGPSVDAAGFIVPPLTEKTRQAIIEASPSYFTPIDQAIADAATAARKARCQGL